MTADPYNILGVSEQASEAEIKGAYRTLARRYHPDGAAGDDESFRMVQAAYDLLADDGRRQAFDAQRRLRSAPAARRRARRGDPVVDVAVDVGGAVEDVVGGLLAGLGRVAGKRRRGS